MGELKKFGGGGLFCRERKALLAALPQGRCRDCRLHDPRHGWEAHLDALACQGHRKKSFP